MISSRDIDPVVYREKKIKKHFKSILIGSVLL